MVDPILGLFRKAFWSHGLPSLAGGVFAAVWALELAVEFYPFGVSGEVQIGVIDKEGAARRLDATEIAGYQVTTGHAVEHLGQYAKVLETSDSREVPDF